MEENKTYELGFPNGTFTIVRLHKINTYPSTGIPTDYIFEYLSGNDALPKCSPLGKNLFPIPERLIPLLKVKEQTKQ